jgi:hypothetical protein
MRRYLVENIKELTHEQLTQVVGEIVRHLNLVILVESTPDYESISLEEPGCCEHCGLSISNCPCRRKP